MSNDKIVQLTYEEANTRADSNDFEEKAFATACSAAEVDAATHELKDIIPEGEGMTVILREKAVVEKQDLPAVTVDETAAPVEDAVEATVEEEEVDPELVRIRALSEALSELPFHTETFEASGEVICAIIAIISCNEELMARLRETMPLARIAGTVLNQFVVSSAADLTDEDRAKAEAGEPVEVTLRPDFLEYKEKWQELVEIAAERAVKELNSRVAVAQAMPSGEFAPGMPQQGGAIPPQNFGPGTAPPIG